jgi:hypothetical protein
MSGRERAIGLVEKFLPGQLVVLAVDGSCRDRELGRLGPEPRQTAPHVLCEAVGERVAFIGLHAQNGEFQGAETGQSVFRPDPVPQAGHDRLFDSAPEVAATEARASDLEQDQGKRELVASRPSELGLDRRVQPVGVQEGGFVVLVGSGQRLPFNLGVRPSASERRPPSVHRQPGDQAQAAAGRWAAPPSLEASRTAFMCAIASIEIIGLTPEAVGKAEPSHT